MTNCKYHGAGGSTSYTELPFPMKILNVHHVVTAPLGQPVYIDMPGPKTPHCPRSDPTGS